MTRECILSTHIHRSVCDESQENKCRYIYVHLHNDANSKMRSSIFAGSCQRGPSNKIDTLFLHCICIGLCWFCCCFHVSFSTLLIRWSHLVHFSFCVQSKSRRTAIPLCSLIHTRAHKHQLQTDNSHVCDIFNRCCAFSALTTFNQNGLLKLNENIVWDLDFFCLLDIFLIFGSIFSVQRVKCSLSSIEFYFFSYRTSVCYFLMWFYDVCKWPQDRKQKTFNELSATEPNSIDFYWPRREDKTKFHSFRNSFEECFSCVFLIASEKEIIRISIQRVCWLKIPYAFVCAFFLFLVF